MNVEEIERTLCRVLQSKQALSVHRLRFVHSFILSVLSQGQRLFGGLGSHSDSTLPVRQSLSYLLCRSVCTCRGRSVLWGQAPRGRRRLDPLYIRDRL